MSRVIKGEALPTKMKTVWRISAIGSLLIGLIIAAGCQFAHIHFGWWVWPAWVCLLVTIIDVAMEFAIVPYRYRFWRYRISDDDVEIESGFFFHRQTAIPINRIQNVTLKAGPILQLVKLQTVQIETAATTHEIEALLPETAEELKQRIMVLAMEAGNEND